MSPHSPLRRRNPSSPAASRATAPGSLTTLAQPSTPGAAAAGAPGVAAGGATVGSLVAALGVGVLLPLQGRVTGALGQRLDDGVEAALLASTAGLAAIVVLVALVPSVRRSVASIPAAVLSRAFPWWAMLAGASAAYFVVTQGLVVGLSGIALFTIANVAGQTLGGIVVDLWGIGPAGRRRVTWTRLVGAAVILAAVVWSVVPAGTGTSTAGTSATEGGFPLLLLLLPFTAGLLNGLQNVLNGMQTAHYRSFIPATLVNFTFGIVLVCLYLGIRTAAGGTWSTPPTQPWYYLGGPIGVLIVGGAASLVKHLGVLLTSLCVIAGQLVGALLLALAWPTVTGGGGMHARAVLGTFLAVGGVALAAVSPRPHSNTTTP